MGNASGKAASRNRNNKKSVHWKAAEKPSPPGRPQLVPGTPTTEPDVVTLRWERPGSDGGAPVIGYMVEHKRTGSPHWVRATPGLVGKPEIALSGLEPGWRYQFRVTAHNSEGISDPSELSEPVTVTFQRTVITAPRFTEELRDTTALENDKVEFMAHFSGIPMPSVCWYKDGFEIFSSRRTRVLTENGHSLLIIHQAALVDEGEIKCTATNKAGHCTTKALLRVEAPPRIRLPRQYEDGLLFELGEVVRLKISVAGKPSPEVFWTHNGEAIANDPRYEVVNSDKTSSLKIGEAKRQDRGEYQIRAVNKLGEHVASFLVTVTDKPQPPVQVRVMSLGKTVTLSWNAPDDDGGCKIGNYIIEYYRVGWNVWLKAGTSRKLSTTLGELIEGSEYRFRVKAENPYGISEPSNESETIFIPDPKRGLLEPPLRSKSQPRELSPPNLENIKGPIRIRSGRSESVTSSRSSLDSRPTSPTSIFSNEPKRPVRGHRIKTPMFTPDPSPITRRRDYHIDPNTRNIFDRSSVTRELSYGTTIGNQNRRDDALFNIFNRSRSPSPSPAREPSPKPGPEPPKNQLFFKEKTPNPNELPRNDDILHGSSEFMLVLYPENGTATTNRKSGSTGNMAFDFDDVAVAPPLSLSAPELGFEPPPLGSLRNAVSSSEILHERAMTRFYEAAAADEAEREKRRVSLDSRSQDLLPRIRINSIETDESIALERKTSLRRRLSGSGLSQQMLWQQRLSWKGGDEISIHENSEPPEPKSVEPEEPTPQKTEIIEKETEPKTKLDVDRNKSLIRQRSASEELEEEMFEQVRAKMAKQNSLEEKAEKAKAIVASEDKWEEETVEENDDIDEEDLSIEEEEEEESEDDRPWSEETIPDRSQPEEEQTYHPRIMIPHSEPSKKSPPPSEAPFEILTKPNPLPDPNFIPKPILKKREIEVITTLTKTLEEKPTPVVEEKKIAPEKPVRKSTPLKETPKRFLKNIAGSFNHLRSKKETTPEPPPQPKSQPMPPPTPVPITPLTEPRWSPPATIVQQEQAKPVVVLSAAELARKKRLESRENSLEEAKVVIEHYGDIVREYGKPRKQAAPLYLSTEALKAAAESQEHIDKLDSDSNDEKPKPTVKLEKQVDKIPEKSNSIDRNDRKSRFDSVETKTKLRRSRTPSLTRKTPEPPPFVRESSVTRPLRAGPIKPALPEPEPEPEPSPERASTPEEEISTAETKVGSAVDYLTDLAMFLLACWLYLFKDERLAIPVLILMVYRQLSDEIGKRIPSWMKRTKKED